jgi:hypothetical protein
MSRSAAADDLDPYAILEIAPTATAAEIRAAYLALVSRYHPDRHEGNPLADLASAKLAEVNRAYEILSDPVRRAAWDAGHARSHLRDRRPGSSGFVGRALVVMVGLGVALRFGPLLLRGLVAVVREAAGLVRGTPLAILPVLVVALILIRVLRRPGPASGTPPPAAGRGPASRR